MKHKAGRSAGKTERKFPKKPPMIDNGTGDASFVLSLALAGAFLKPKETKSQTEIMVTPKEEVKNQNISSSGGLMGIALVLTAVGMAFKYRLLTKYESFRNQEN